MRPKLHNRPAEAYYFKCLRRWRDALKNKHLYEEHSLKFLFDELEKAWRKVGYTFGDEN